MYRRLPEITWALLAAVFASNVYRAATQAITLDEAFTYSHFVAPPLYEVMTSYDPNHHVLNSLLAKVTTGLFGVSEFTLRIPSLLGGLIYLLAVRAILLYAFSSGWALAGFALLSLNPFVLDYLIAARGYGLALGFLMAALWFLLRGAWYRAGISLGLTIAANLAFLFPVVALGALVALAEIKRNTFGRFLECVLVPAGAIPFIAYVLPLSRAKAAQFSWGAPTLAEGLDSMITLSFERNRPPFTNEVELAVTVLAVCTLIGGVAAALLLLRRKQRTPLEEVIVLSGASMGGCFAMSWIAHLAAGVPYPFTRTGLYWPVLLTLTGVALADQFMRWRPLRFVAGALAGLCLLLFLRGFELGYFQEWQFDAGAKRIAALILRQGGRGKLRIACTAVLIHSLEYYRDRYGAQWELNPKAHADAEFHVLAPYDFTPGMQVQYRDPVSEAVVLYTPRQ